jgi:hypothetical protein
MTDVSMLEQIKKTQKNKLTQRETGEGKDPGQ